MAITVEEKPSGGTFTTGDSPSAEFNVIVRGTTSRTEAEAAIREWSGLTFEGLSLKSVSADPVFVNVDDADACIWDGTARFEKQGEKKVGDTLVSSGFATFDSRRPVVLHAGLSPGMGNESSIASIAAAKRLFGTAMGNS